ncbi:hypothetical protein [Virgibacillus dakarensis]|uniref:hypothetical protein n=1 Tax=Virgibacillus dakarensis TaxID=1917889 RepID=UPI001F2644B9|nr:hypothetical protein [Virgibacillus dakarensis]
MKNLEKLILHADFKKADEITSNLSFDVFSEEILEITYENESIANYSFINFLINKRESNELHDLAFDLLVNPLCHIEGAYNSALYHAKQSVMLTAEKEIGSLENLLFLNSIPDKLVSDQHAIRICKKILSLDNSNQTATDTLNDLNS